MRSDADTILALSAVLLISSGLSSLLAGDSDPPLNATATIDFGLTPAGHVGAQVEVTFSGPTFYSVADWGAPRFEGGTIFLEAKTGSPFTIGGDPPFPPRIETHLAKLFDVQRPPTLHGEALAFRTVTFPGGTSPIPEGEVVLRSREEWNAWIAPYDLTQGPLPIRPPVDFDREIFVGVFLGPTSGCHAVEIRRMTALADGAVQVDYTAEIPAPDKPVTEGLINPRHVAALARTNAPIHFVREVSVVPPPARDVPVTRPDYPFIAPEAPMTSVIRSEAAWSRFLDRVAGERDPALPGPPVDLSKQMLIGVFLGRTPLGRGVSISNVSENGHELLVEILETIGGAPPPPDEFAYPLDFIAVPRSELPVRFRRTILAFPSPPPPGGPAAPDEAEEAESLHGFFEVVFRLDDCELVRRSFNYPAIPPPSGVVLDALSESATTLALDATFDLGLSADTIVHWEPPLQDGQNLSANLAVLPKPEKAGVDISFPGPGSFSHRYAIENLAPGLYRFELRVNGGPAGHLYFRHPSWEGPPSAFEARLEAVLLRPVWEPVPAFGLLGDLDGDQAGDFLEDALGSDPFDCATLPSWQVRAMQPPGESSEVEIVLTRRVGIEVDLEHSADLTLWQQAMPPPVNAIEPLESNPGMELLRMRWFPPLDPRTHFYRLRVSEQEGGE